MSLCQKRALEPIWDCSLPLGEIDLRLDLPEFAPVFRWGVEAAAGSPPEPIQVALLRGADVEGWIDAGGGIARLRPAGKWRSISEERLDFAARRVDVHADGRLHFQNVAPGRYELSVEATDIGRAELDLVVEADDERVVLGDIPLQGRERVALQVEPPRDGWGEPWSVSLSAMESGARASVERVALDLNGFGEAQDVTPGRYWVNVRDSQGSVWHLAPHELGVGAPLVLSIPHVPVEGSVRAGDEPLIAILVFGTTQGATQLRFRSDERGRFEGYLPKEGLWELELGDAAMGCGGCGGELGVTLLPPVEVEVGPSGKAFVEIRLPGTRIEGRVVRGPSVEEVPVAEAQVVAVRPDGPPGRMGRLAQVWTDGEGRFVLRGIEPGRLTIGARSKSGDGESSWEEVELREEMDLPELVLRIEEKVPLRVRLTRGGAPVPGARLYAFPATGSSAHATTGLDGFAEVLLPARSTGSLLVDAPGLGLLLEPFGTGDAPRPALTLEVSAAAGDVLLEGWNAPPLHGTLVHRGAGVSLHVLRNLVRERVVTTEAGVAFTGLTAGDYTICLGFERGCRTITVAPSETTSLGRTDGEESPR